MNDKWFMPKKRVSNFDKIIDRLKKNAVVDQLNGLEMLHNIITMLNKYDKKRDNSDPELKRAVFTLVNEILDKKIAAPSFMMAYNYPYPPPEEPFTKQQLFEYLDNNWFEMDAVDRGYLLAFVPYKEGESPLKEQ